MSEEADVIGKRHSAWRLRALQIIDEFERGVLTTLSVSALAAGSSVSRTTIWRDKDLSKRLANAKSYRKSRRGVGHERPTSQSRIVQLQAELAMLKIDNHRLIESLSKIYVRLYEEGLDATLFISSAGSDHQVVKAISDLLASFHGGTRK